MVKKLVFLIYLVELLYIGKTCEPVSYQGSYKKFDNDIILSHTLHLLNFFCAECIVHFVYEFV